MIIQTLLDKCEDAYARNDFKRVIKICDEILSGDSKNQTALGYKARALHLIGEHENALRLLDDAMSSYPDNYYFLDIRAEVLMGMEEYGGAIECFERIFEMDVADKTALDFIRLDYETCLSLKTIRLVERESYVEAWKCYNRRLEVEGTDLERPQAIERFMRLVKDHTSKPKYRQYRVRISSEEAKSKLVKFLNENGFRGDGESGLTFLIDVIERTYRPVSLDGVRGGVISESKFYDKVNYCHWNGIVRKKIFGPDNVLLYEGYTLDDAPYGFGTAYFANGNVYREGIFDIKGIVQGREYYPSGQLRFEGQWSLTRGYGPNVPYDGDAYDEYGGLIHSGKFKITRTGIGWPRILNPKGFPPLQKEYPKIKYF